MRTNFALLAAAAATFAATAPASASVAVYELQQSYTVATLYDLHHGMSVNTYANGGGATNSYNIAAPGGTFYDPFPKSSGNPPLLTYFLMTSNLSDEVSLESDAPDGHLVVAFNDVFAAALITAGDDFSVTFSGYDESSLIAALTLLDTTDLDMLDDGYADQKAAKDDAYDLLGGFSNQVNLLGGFTAANGGSLTLVSFSTPALAGTGIANLTPIAGPVPEPASWMMMIGGFGAVGVGMRKRRRIAVAFG